MTLCIRGRGDCYIACWLTCHPVTNSTTQQTAPFTFPWMLHARSRPGWERAPVCFHTSPGHRSSVILTRRNTERAQQTGLDDRSGNGHGGLLGPRDPPAHAAAAPEHVPGTRAHAAPGRPQHSPAPWGSGSRPGRRRGCGSAGGPCSSPSAPRRSSSTSFRRAASPRGRALRT